MKKVEIVNCIMIMVRYLKENGIKYTDVLERNNQNSYLSETLLERTLMYKNKETLNKIMSEITELAY